MTEFDAWRDEVMPAVCHFWQMTPAEFDALDWSDLQRLVTHQEKVQREERNALDELDRLRNRIGDW